MFNLKNILILCFSAVLAAFISLMMQKFVILGQLYTLLLTGLLTGIFMQIMQSFKSTTTSAKKVTNDNNNQRESGTVKWFDSNKGYGFITRSMGEDIFVHFRSIRGNGYRSLHEGQAVEFIVTDGDKGPQAEDIHVIK